MEGFTRDTREIDIQKLLMDTFDVKEKEFASIKKGQTCGYVRFHDKETAIKLVAKINECLGKSEMLSVKGAEINFRILEGKEETVYLEHTLRVLKAHINKKRGLDMTFGQREYNENLARKKFKKKVEKRNLDFCLHFSKRE